jgi:hypothetical protein
MFDGFWLGASLYSACWRQWIPPGEPSLAHGLESKERDRIVGCTPQKSAPERMNRAAGGTHCGSGSGCWRLGLEFGNTNKLRVRRRSVGLLAIFSCALLSGGGDSLRPVSLVAEGSPPDSSSSPVTEVLGVLEQSLALANPSLSRGERSRIAAAIDRYSAWYRLDPDLVMAILLVESDARPWARSPKGAVGLMQVMPHMMRPMGLAETWRR